MEPYPSRRFLSEDDGDLGHHSRGAGEQ